MTVEQLTRSLTHILNNYIDNLTFPSAWKTARISTIPKVKEIKSNSDLRSISILPFLSKVYERLVLRQMVNFLSFGPFGIFKESLGAYGKGHSTTTVLLAMRDNILHSVKRGEVTMAILADFSKAFDTVTYETVLKKMQKLGFSKSYLRWVTSYLTERKQFVQIDDKLSSTIEVALGVLQGFILGPVIFNLYVNDFSDSLEASVTSHQYADDTTIYAHSKPANIKQCEDQLQYALDQLSTWSSECNLHLNPDKTKVMLFSTQQLARVHKLDEYPINLHTNGAKLERIKTTRLLGPEIDENLKWNDDILSKISKCYKTLAVIKKLKNLAPFHVRKRLAESLVMSLIDYNDIVCHPIPKYLTKRLQRVKLAAASFVYNHHADMSDVLKLG